MQSDNIAQYMVPADNTGSFVPQYQSSPPNEYSNQRMGAPVNAPQPDRYQNFDYKNATPTDSKKPSIFSRMTEIVKKQPGIVVGIICALVILLIGIIIYYRGIGPVGPAAAYAPCKAKKSAKVVKPVVEPGAAPFTATPGAEAGAKVQQKSNVDAEIDKLIGEIEN